MGKKWVMVSNSTGSSTVKHGDIQITLMLSNRAKPKIEELIRHANAFDSLLDIVKRYRNLLNCLMDEREIQANKVSCARAIEYVDAALEEMEA